MPKIILLILLSFAAIILTPYRAYAVPSLIPFIPIIGAVIIKASTIVGSIIFFALSIIKKNKKIFTLFGIMMFLVSLFLMAYYR